MWLYYNVMYQVIICTKLLKKVNVSKFTLKKMRENSTKIHKEIFKFKLTNIH